MTTLDDKAFLKWELTRHRDGQWVFPCDEGPSMWQWVVMVVRAARAWVGGW